MNWNMGLLAIVIVLLPIAIELLWPIPAPLHKQKQQDVEKATWPRSCAGWRERG
jgi:hypothetical protein